jgi:hypothetical protein
MELIVYGKPKSMENFFGKPFKISIFTLADDGSIIVVVVVAVSAKDDEKWQMAEKGV